MTDYCVTRQIQWPDGICMIEISIGDYNHTNPGEVKLVGEYDFAVEAAEAAIADAIKWSKDKTVEIGAGYGHTIGSLEESDPEDILAWAIARDAKLECCGHCGDKIPANAKTYTLLEFDDWPFCSPECANRSWEDAEESYRQELEESEESEEIEE